MNQRNEKPNNPFNKTQENQTKSTSENSKPGLSPISLPKGGGAIRGIGEKFTNNPVTGTGTLSVPIYTSPGRSGFGPNLELTYDSGDGNGPFGYGWNVSNPSITRKVDKQIPTYNDDCKNQDCNNEPDIFLLSGHEDLIPLLVEDVTGKWQPEDLPPLDIDGVLYKVQNYRPRIEGLFARIERWINLETGEVYWRSISKTNITTSYGKSTNSRIADPSDPTRVFSWLICESFDDKGNVIFYEYKSENSQQVNFSSSNESNRTEKSRSANRYLKRIKYGNKSPYRRGENLSSRKDWMFEVVFDYGEHYFNDIKEHISPLVLFNDDQDSDNVDRQWKIRKDPFSSYRSGFEIRTYRLCQHILMFHHFTDELGVDDYLVKSTDFIYEENSNASFISVIRQSGYILTSDSRYKKKSLPPLEFQYNKGMIRDKVEKVEKESLENLPMGLDGTRYQWVDLDGEGLSGILTEQAGAWFYKRNISSLPMTAGVNKDKCYYKSDGPLDKFYSSVVKARFAPLSIEKSIPSFSGLGSSIQQLMDLQGDGSIDLVEFDTSVSGYFKRSMDEGKWNTFVPFNSVPNVNWQDPNLRFIDLTGDGHADILIAEDKAFVWYRSLAEKGFDTNCQKGSYPMNEIKDTPLIFANNTQSTYLADMSGDGLTDLVHIENGEVWYLPNLGYGRFGNKVVMDNLPWFDNPDQFDQKRIRLADIDGSGTTDVIYIGRDGIKVFFNESGNRFSEVRVLKSQFPFIDNLSSVMVVDLLGNGTSCLVWSSSLRLNSSDTMYYIDFMGGQKPHLLTSIKNNMGTITKIQYCTSTKFYLADKYAGKPWITKLPFPVQVVERVETFDLISRTRLVSKYTYHDGYFDPREREFNGFSYVEQWDTESFDLFEEYLNSAVDTSSAHYNKNDIFTPKGLEEGFHVPPIHIKTWFHCGAYPNNRPFSNYFTDRDYFREKKNTKSSLLSDSFLPEGLKFNEEVEAFRSLKGVVLRQEIYADDNTEQSIYPYNVTENNYKVRIMQPLSEYSKHAVFYTYGLETISIYYERNPHDPRIQHHFNLLVDEHGNVMKQVTVNYPRRQLPNSKVCVYPEQSKLNAVINLTDYAKIIHEPERNNVWITGYPYQSKSLEINDTLKLRKEQDLFQFFEIDNAATLALENIKNFGDDFDYDGERTIFQSRLFHWERNFFWNVVNKEILELGSITAPVLLNHKETAVFPISYFNALYHNTIVTQKIVGRKIVEKEGGYHQDSSYWWDKSAEQYYQDDAGFYLPDISVDPFGSFDRTTFLGKFSQIEYDKKYHLMPIRFTDPLKSVTQALPDYRVLRPMLVIDNNDNTYQAYYDELGVVIASSIFGSEEDILKGDGDLYDSGTSHFKIYSDATIENISTNPEKYIQHATSYFFYDALSWKHHGVPLHVVMVQREIHLSDQKPSEKPRFQIAIQYSDGLGRELQKKLKVDEGFAWIKQSDGSYKEQYIDERWLTSGNTIFNNKGNPVKQYEPFYSGSKEYETEESITKFGITPIIHYDPLGRIIKTDTPKGFFSTVIFEPWKIEYRDENDNVRNSRFYDELLNYNKHPPSWTPERINFEKKTLQETESHANTPKIKHMNNLAQIFLEEDYVDEKRLYTYYEMDISGNKLSITDPRQYEKNKTRSSKEQFKNFRFCYDMLNRQIQSLNLDIGIVKVFQNSINNPVYSWTARHCTIHIGYDSLGRPTDINASGENDLNVLNNLVEKIQYGESNIEAKRKNQCNKPVIHHDQSGIKNYLLYDIDGHNIKLETTLREEYKKEVNWNVEHDFIFPTYFSESNFDALGRLIKRKQSDKSIHELGYHTNGLLKSLSVKLENEDAPKYYVKDIQYNAKGQRQCIKYGNDTISTYTYDKLTHRLESMKTKRSSDLKILQEVSYIQDPVGNITYIKNENHRTVFFNQSRVDPISVYKYDSIYRLIQASGRQHVGINPDHHKYPHASKQSRHPFENVSINDSNALENYSETYQYDSAGNLQQTIHSVFNNSSHGWTRRNTFADGSNRIESSLLSDSRNHFAFDNSGNMNNLEHIEQLKWNYRNSLSSVILIGRVEGEEARNDAEYYVYDTHGKRVKKVVEHYIKIDGIFKFLDIEQKIYLDGYEIKQIKRINLETKISSTSLERVSCHIVDDKNRIAIIHKWNIDTSKRETDDITKIKVHYQLENHLGSSVFELDQMARIISYEEYYPYGGTSYIAGSSSFSSLSREVSLKTYRFAGKEMDHYTQLYYYGSRYFVFWLGRWASPDPQGLVDGTNLYSFTRNNPINFTDPSGNESKLIKEVSTYREYDKRTGWKTIEHSTQWILPTVVIEADKKPSATVANDQNLREPSGNYEQKVPYLLFFVKIPMAYVRPYQPAPQGSPVGLDAIRQLNGQPAVGVANFSRDYAPGTHFVNLTSHIVNANAAAVNAGAALGFLKHASTMAEPMSMAARSGGMSLTIKEGRPTLQLSENVSSIAENASAAEGGTGSAKAVQLPLPPTGKTVAGTPEGPVTTSGWGRASQIPGYEGAPAIEVWEMNRGTGTFPPHGHDFPGAPGSYYASHAEPQALFLNPTTGYLEISKIPCPNCGPMITQFVNTRGTPLIVLSPEGLRWYFPGGLQYPPPIP